ncbi:MAG TPA: hypothetical protein VGY66_03615 [Gemmataceae bacterium]|jgi:hypothetical protein|nr:hypothetical protein [Gemmataceae bacterium]
MHSTKLYLVPLLLLAFFATSGCRKGEQRLAPVHGTIYYRQQPLKGGTIVFIPDADKGGKGPMARAEIKPDGTYTLTTGPDNGCVPGWHRLTIRGSDQPSQGTPLTLPRDKYCDPETSGLTREVKPGQDNAIDIYLN